MRKNGNGTYVKQLDKDQLVSYCIEKKADRNRTKPDRVLPHYAAASTQEILAGFFAQKVVLVEGPSEAMALPIYFRRLQYDTDKLGVAIISVGGKGNLAKWWRLFTAYGIPAYVIFDNDSEDYPDAVKRTDVLRTLNKDEQVIEQLLAAERCHFSAGVLVFGKDFETTLRGSLPGYADLEEEARKIVSDDRSAKPLRARYIAELVELEKESKVHPALANLVSEIEKLG